MKWALSAAILFYTTVKAQTTTTLPNALAKETRYINIPKFDYQTNGHPYTVGVTLGAALLDPAYITKIDLVTKQITTKVLPGAYSHIGGFWEGTYDSLGRMYISWAVDNYHVFGVDFKDSINIIDNGLVFQNSTIALAYSAALGEDKHMYFGAKGDPYFSEYNPYNFTTNKYPPINSYGIDWVLSVSGDANYIYATTGQNDSCNFWAIKKSDGSKRNLIKVPNYTRPTIETACDGFVYVLDPYRAKWYKMVNGDTVHVPDWAGCRIYYYGIGNITSFFDKAKSRLFWNGAGLNDSVDISSSVINQAIRTVFTDRTDTNIVYYIGDYYGSTYKYNISGDSAIVLGNTGFNISSSVFQINDSMFYWGAYPSGAFFVWNKNRAWTTGTYVNNTVVSAADSGANPKILFTARSTSAIIHHLSGLQYDSTTQIFIWGGEQERTDYTCSWGTYNVLTGAIQSYDAAKIVALGFSGFAKWGNYYIMSTTNAYGGTPKLYVCNPANCTMVDSINVGFNDYGRIWTQGDQLLGQTFDGKFYKINLSTKQISYNQQGTGNPVCVRLADGSFTINGGTAPTGWGKIRTVSYQNYTANKTLGTYFTVSTTNVLRTQSLISETIDVSTAAGMQKYIRNLLY